MRTITIQKDVPLPTEFFACGDYSHVRKVGDPMYDGVVVAVKFKRKYVRYDIRKLH